MFNGLGQRPDGGDGSAPPSRTTVPEVKMGMATLREVWHLGRTAKSGRGRGGEENRLELDYSLLLFVLPKHALWPYFLICKNGTNGRKGDMSQTENGEDDTCRKELSLAVTLIRQTERQTDKMLIPQLTPTSNDRLSRPHLDKKTTTEGGGHKLTGGTPSGCC